MAFTNVQQESPQPQPVLAPYAHELNSGGTDCAADCPACRWSSERVEQMKGSPCTYPFGH